MTRKILLIAIIGSIFFGAYSYAAGDASTYKITVQRIELKNTADTWVTIATPNQEIDIASVAAGAVAGSLLNDAAIPVGNYDNFRIRVSETIKVSGSDGANYTNASGSAILTGDAATSADLPGTITAFTESAETWNNTSAGEMTIQVNLDGGDADSYFEVYGTTDLATPISITLDSTISMWFDFDTQSTINYTAANGLGVGIPASDAMYFTPPGSGTAFSITVDGTTTTITAANMTMAF